MLFTGVAPLDAEGRPFVRRFRLISFFTVQENLVQDARDRPEGRFWQLGVGVQKSSLRLLQRV